MTILLILERAAPLNHNVVAERLSVAYPDGLKQGGIIFMEAGNEYTRTLRPA